jgi:hypothetical protein
MKPMIAVPCPVEPMASVPRAMKSVIFVSRESATIPEVEFTMFPIWGSMEFMKPVVFLMPFTTKFVRSSVELVMFVFFSFTVKKRVIAVIPIVSIISIRPGIVFASPVIVTIGGTAESRQDNEE